MPTLVRGMLRVTLAEELSNPAPRPSPIIVTKLSRELSWSDKWKGCELTQDDREVDVVIFECHPHACPDRCERR